MTDLPGPGPELDALVAREVMQWVMCPEFARPGIDTSRVVAFRKDDRSPIMYSWDANFDHPSPLISGLRRWSPSTRIQDAWEVVEAVPTLLADGYLGRSRTDHLKEPKPPSWCYRKPGGKRWRVDGITAPHAICLAALAAVSNEERP